MTTLTRTQLRPYQTKGINNAVTEFLRPTGKWRQLGVLPTGTGKTVVFSNLTGHDAFERYLRQFPKDQRKVLIIAHRDELLNQAKEKYEHWNPEARVEIEQADRWASPDADVVVASIQTLANRKGRRLMRFDRKQFRIVIIDEAHHATASSYVSVMQYFGFLPPDDFMPKPGKLSIDEALKWQRERLAKWDATGKPHRLLLGVTATPRRSDRVGLELVFQTIVFEEKMVDMIRQGYLSRLRALRIHSSVDLDPVHTNGGDFDEQELANAIDNVERNRVIVKAWLEHARGLQTIAFTVNVQHALDLAEEYRAAGVNAAAIHGNSLDRAELLEAFAAGEIQVLTNCNLLTEGFDEPNVQCIVHARPTKSPTLYTQMTGRGTRIAPGKTHCLILDVVDVTTRHSLMTAATLVGLPAEYDAKGKDLVDDLDKIEKLKEEHPLLDTSTARSLEDIQVRATEVDLFGPFRMPEIEENSTMAWMQSGNKYVISWIGGKTHTEQIMRIKPDPFGNYHITVEEYGREYRIMAPVPDIHSAFAQAESWLREKIPGQIIHLERDAKWRKRKASLGQMQYLAHLRQLVDEPAIDVSGLSAGQAADLIAFYKLKSQGRII